MEVDEGRELVIKMAQKNKETQTTTVKPGPPNNWFAQVAAYQTVVPRYTGPPMGRVQAFMPRPSVHPSQFYMNREQELYRRACRLKGIRLGCLPARETHETEQPEKETREPPYRYTLDEMKRLNPYRLVNHED